MSDHAITAVVSFLIAIMGLAILAELLSRSANTGGVLGALGGSISQALCTAISPVTGKTCGTNTLFSVIPLPTREPVPANNSGVVGYGCPPDNYTDPVTGACIPIA